MSPLPVPRRLVTGDYQRVSTVTPGSEGVLFGGHRGDYLAAVAMDPPGDDVTLAE